jgi:L-Ala-D/L-Glu epimerase
VEKKMKIIKAEIYGIRLPLKKPFIISYANYDTMPSVIVKITTDDGLIGYGEAVPDEHVTGEFFEGVIAVLKHQLIPAILGENPFHIEYIHEKMDQVIYRNPAAKAAIDIACYDLMGKAANQPVYNLIGGKAHKQLTYAKVLSIEEPDDMAKNAQEAIDQGYTSLKLKVGYDIHKDVERIKAVRQQVGYEIPIRVDVNQGWKTYEKAAHAIKLLEPYRISWVEQPLYLEDIDGMAQLKKITTIPIMADESVQTFMDLHEIIQRKAADIINIKLMKSGGIYPAIALAKIAESAGLTCQVGSMVESSIGSAAGYHVAMSKKVIQSTELTGPLLFKKDIGDLTYNIPYVYLNDKPGLGVEVNEHILNELTVHREEISY